MSSASDTSGLNDSLTEMTEPALTVLPHVSTRSPDEPWTPQGYVSPRDSLAYLQQTSELDNGLDQTDNVSVSGGAIAELDTVINCGLIPALVVLGVIGNCLCVAVLVKQRYHSVAKPLLLALCVSGVLFLLCALLVVLSKIAARFDTESGRVLEVVMTPQVAVLRDVIGRVTVVMTLAIGVERSVTMTRHFKMKALCTVPRTRSVVLAVYIIVFALMAPLFFRYDVIEHRVLPDNVTRLKLRRTTFYLDNRIAMDFYTDFLLPAFLRLLPFVSMCVCFTVIVVSFKRRLQCRTGHQQTPRTGAFARARGGAGHENRDESAHADLALEERKLTRALLVVLLICILCEVSGLVTQFVHVIRPSIQSNAFLVAQDVSGLLETFNSAVYFPVFMVAYKQFSVTFCTLTELSRRQQQQQQEQQQQPQL